MSVSNHTLTAYVASFSYHLDGIPTDPFGHGGGFVFDCRILHNPGKLEPYKDYTGLQSNVKQWMESNPPTENFWQSVVKIVDFALKMASEKRHHEISFCFGCTGGRHRSVYMANRLADYLRDQGHTVILEHIQLKKLGLI